EDIAAVETCRELAQATIEDIAREWTRNQMSGWNAAWFLYQAAMIPLVSIFWQWNSPRVQEWQKLVETVIELLDTMEDWSLTARRSREVVWRMYDASRQPVMMKGQNPIPALGTEHSLMTVDPDLSMSPIGFEPDGLGMMSMLDQQGLWDVDALHWDQGADGTGVLPYGMNEGMVPLSYD